jgi:hypothetical protein
MIKYALAALVVLVTTAALIAAQDRLDCEGNYRSALERLNRQRMPPERRATLSRKALRIFDACQTGDLKEPKRLFESLDRWKD